MMRFSKTNNIYKIIRITGSQDNILGISFGEDNIEVIEWNFNNIEMSNSLYNIFSLMTARGTIIEIGSQ